jgi:hypothetical protein
VEWIAIACGIDGPAKPVERLVLQAKLARRTRRITVAARALGLRDGDAGVKQRRHQPRNEADSNMHVT